MDIDAMSTEKRITLIKKGACFICEKPGHMARDHDEYVKKVDKQRNEGIDGSSIEGRREEERRQ